MNNDNFLIEQTDLELAKDICKYIDNPSVRNRAAANVLAAKIAKGYFQDYEADTNSGLHNIFQVLCDIEIADIYLNNSYIDVRLYFNENEMGVPKSHFDRNLLPLAYMFIKLDPELSGGLVTGFVLPAAVDTSKDFGGYYRVSENDLISFYDVEAQMVSSFDEDLPENLESMIFDYLDGKLEDKNSFYKVLLESKEARRLLYNAAKAQNVFKFVSVTAPEQKETVAEQPALALEEDTELVSIDTEISMDLDAPVLDLEESGDLVNDSFDAEELAPVEDFGNIGLESDEQESLVSFDEPDLIQQEDISEQPAIEEPEPEEEITIKMVEPSFENIGFSDLSAEPDNSFMVDIAEENKPEESSPFEQEVAAEEEPVSTLEIEENVGEVPAAFEEATTDETDVLEFEPAQTAYDVPEDQDVPGEEETGFEEYTTAVTPSIDSIEETSDINEVDLDNLAEMLEKADAVRETNSVPDKADPQIDELFGQEAEENVSYMQVPKKKGSKLLPVICILAICGALGYFGYTKFVINNNMPSENPLDVEQTIPNPETAVEASKQEVAMPVETVENVDTSQQTDEGTAVSIPAIEQNLDASILVSNLNVNWEVPSGYVTNNTAKRYFTKMGKVIQLNLKTELLLLNKPPITNKISLEVEFNKSKQKFEIKGIVASSGEKTVDDLIVKTVGKALDMNLSMNMSSFGSLAGNPVLVIRL